jgi:hypothetical protein
MRIVLTLFLVVPYVAAMPARATSSSGEGGRQMLPGSRTDRTGGLADASQKFVNDRLLAMLAGTEAGQADCQQTVPTRPGRRPQR